MLLDFSCPERNLVGNDPSKFSIMFLHMNVIIDAVPSSYCFSPFPNVFVFGSLVLHRCNLETLPHVKSRVLFFLVSGAKPPMARTPLGLSPLVDGGIEFPGISRGARILGQTT